jgi:hypothetical protein
MTDQRITDLFSRLNELPSEVPLSEVEHWARLHAAGQLMPQAPNVGAPGKLPWYSFKPPLYMTSILIAGAASGLAALIAVNTTSENPAPQQNQPAVALTDSALLMPADTPVVKVNVKQNPNGDSLRREYIINAPANARITVSASDNDAVTNLQITPNGIESRTDSNTEDPDGYSYNYEQDENGEVSVEVNPSGNYNDECHCNTQSDSIQKAFVKELLADGIITTDKNYKFMIDLRKFVVNGKRQPADVHAKYLRLYSKLNGDQGISGSFSWQVQVSSN